MNCYLAQQRFDEISKKHRAKICLYLEDESVSYGDLYRLSNKMGRSLSKNGVKGGDRIAVILPKSINLIRAILGVLKADAIYVPVDPKAPIRRMKEILADCSPSGIVCDKSTMAKIDSAVRGNHNRVNVWVLGIGKASDSGREFIGENEIKLESSKEPRYNNIDKDIAYIIYTSGSTGKPKGVMISHFNIYNYIDWATDYFKIDENDNVLNTSHFYYDMSTFDIYCTLHTGASLTIVPEKTLLFPSGIMDIIEKKEITIWKGISSLFGYCVKIKSLRPERIKSLKKIIFSGEALATKYLIEWMKTYPGKEFYNAYGPTECTGISTFYRIEEIPRDAGLIVPIGKACANSEIFSLVGGSKPVRAGEVGELYIRGSSVGSGYWNDRERTTRSFVPNPLNEKFEERVYKTGDLVRQLEDGNFVFIGRIDNQIKHMGYRIELGEIEHVLQGVEHIKDVAVIAVSENGDENNKIIAYIEVDEEGSVDEIQIQAKDRLPKHMVPEKYEVVNRIRRLENGKVDRQFLKRYYMTAKIE